MEILISDNFVPLKLYLDGRKVKAFIKFVEPHCYIIKAVPVSNFHKATFKVDVVIAGTWCYGQGSDEYSDDIFEAIEEYEDALKLTKQYAL